MRTQPIRMRLGRVARIKPSSHTNFHKKGAFQPGPKEPIPPIQKQFDSESQPTPTSAQVCSCTTRVLHDHTNRVSTFRGRSKSFAKLQGWIGKLGGYLRPPDLPTNGNTASRPRISRVSYGITLKLNKNDTTKIAAEAASDYGRDEASPSGSQTRRRETSPEKVAAWSETSPRTDKAQNLEDGDLSLISKICSRGRRRRRFVRTQARLLIDVHAENIFGVCTMASQLGTA